ncbi:NLRP3 protein, partial [Polypterus senegalus]|nr:NLRP3 protein [Polypterus senegalus]
MELTEQELTRFWKKLGSIETKHECKHIPYGRLEQAIKSGDSAGELSHLMVGHYERKAIDVLKDTLDEIGRKDQAKKVEDHSSQFKEEIKRKLKKIREYNSLPMERVDFSARFTKLTLVKKHQQQEDKKNELKAKGKEHTELMKKHRNMSIDIENLFTLVDEEKEEKQKTEPKTVVIQGPAGIGKSFTIHKIMLDWASGELFHDRFQYVFQLRCRELRIHKNDSLDDLILKCSRNLKPALEDILSKPEQVLFIFDGFDELSAGWTDNMNEEDVTSTTVMELLSRNIMPQASLLITTRPTALQALDNIVVIDRYIEIVGFLEDEIKEYFIKSFEDQEKALSAFNIIKGNKVVLSLCFLPIMCWIVCSMMKQALQPGEDIMKNMKTNTQVLIHFVNKLLEHHCRTSEKTEFLKIVSSLAFTGIKEEKLVFKNKDLKKFSINPTGNESPFFGKLFYKTDMDAKSVFHFMHLSIQELFAAMHCVSQSSTEEAVQLLNDSLHRDNLIDVVRFLFGLTDVKSQKIIEDFEMLSPALLKTCLLNWIPEAAASYKKQSPFFLQLLHCLYEIQDPQFAKTAMTTLSNIKLVNRPLSSIDCAVIKYCIEQSDSIQCLDIDIILVEEQVKILWDILPKCQFVR